MSDVHVVNDAAAGRYRLLADGAEVGYLEYDPVGDTSLLIKHTEVAAEHEGRGYGSLLVRHVLDEARQSHRTVIPICPYALAFIRRHREYADVVRADMRRTL